MAEKAGKAAPAVAIAGALVAAPQAQHAVTKATTVASAPAPAHPAPLAPLAAHQQPTVTLDSFSMRGNGDGAITASTGRAAAQSAARDSYYAVRTGDTLSGIADRHYHNANAWQWLYHENDKTLRDPNLIYPGQTLFVPAHVPANYPAASYVPRHAKPAATVSAATVTTVVTRSVSQGSQQGSESSSGHSTGRSSGSGSSTLSGRLGCSGLEQLWMQAGGNPGDAFMAAEIAMAESGGNQYALSPTSDYGYWQINVSNGSLATFNAYGNARAAVIISHDGTDWHPWTTYTSGAYAGRC